MSRENDHSAYENWIDPASITPYEKNAKDKIYYRTYCAFVGNSLPITLIEFQNDRIFVPYNAWG